MRSLLKISILVLLFCNSCTYQNEQELYDDPNQIRLKWNQSFDGERIKDATLGLNWALGQVGALNTANSTNGFRVSENFISFNLKRLGFSDAGFNSIWKLHQSILNSDGYLKQNQIDLGRYVTLLIGVSSHYYLINGVPDHLKDILKNYEVHPKAGYVNNSAISVHHRTLRFSAQKGLKQLFISEERDSVTMKILEIETIELMANGHLKFGIFDADSLRINAANPQLSKAGKPAKCMWCHESKILPLLTQQEDVLGYMTYAQLNDSLNKFRQGHIEKKEYLYNGIDFSELQDHAKMEWIYSLFMRPSVMRLSNEWNISEADVSNLLRDHMLFTNSEYPLLPAGYFRENISGYGPITELEVSSSVREKSKLEVNYID